MIRNTFMRKFRRLASTARWKVLSDGCLRTKIDKKLYCPITFVCMKETDMRYDVTEVSYAANVLSIDTNDEMYIVGCADSEEKDLVGNHKVSRRALLKAAGLHG